MVDPADGKRYAIEVQDSFAPKFDAWYGELANDPYGSTFTYGRRKMQVVIDNELANVSPGAVLLDVGCGTGFHIAHLRERGFEVVGIEPGEELRRRAQEHNPGVRIDDGDIENLAFPDASFDVVLAVEVLRHLQAPELALAEVARVLRPGGLAIVTAAPLWSLNGYALINKVTSRVRVPTFTKSRQSFMTERHARLAMARAGFSSCEVHGSVLGPWPAVERLSKPLLRSLLRAFEPLDDRLSDRPVIRDLSSMFVLIGRR